jgi:hypothetical protein
MTRTPVEKLDGCELDFVENPTEDEDITGLVLFASASSEKEIEELKTAWEEIFNA